MLENRVTILITAYNCENFISKMLNSLLNQTNHSFNVIVCDDGSLDNTLLTLYNYRKLFSEANIDFVILHQNNKGVSACLNKMLKLVHTDYFVSADSDDWYDEDFVDSIYCVLEKSDFKLGLCSAKYWKNNILNEVRVANNFIHNDMFENYLKVDKIVCYSGVHIYNLKEFMKMNPTMSIYDSAYGQNWQLILPMILGTKICFINSFYNVTMRDNSMSRSSSYVEEINRLSGYHDILFHILTNLKLIDKYKTYIDQKYYSQKLNLAFRNNKKSDFLIYYRNLNFSFKRFIKKIIISNHLLNNLYFGK